MENCLNERNACMDFISLTVITSKRSKRVNQVIPGVQQPSSSVVYCAPTQSKPAANWKFLRSSTESSSCLEITRAAWRPRN